MRKWFCTKIFNSSLHGVNPSLEVVEECEAIEKDEYKVENIVYVEGEYQIFYSRLANKEDEY